MLATQDRAVVLTYEQTFICALNRGRVARSAPDTQNRKTTIGVGCFDSWAWRMAPRIRLLKFPLV